MNNHKGNINVGFAPLRGSNFAHVLYTDRYATSSEEKGEQKESTGKVVKCLRFGTPTYQGALSTNVLEELKLFLDSYKQQGKKHIYFNHQNPFGSNWYKGWFGDERGRIKQIDNLAQEEQYRDTFYTVNLPFDGDFFEQRGVFSNLNNTTEFVKEFKESLIQQKHGLKFPDFDGRDQILKEAVDSVLEDCFEGRETLTPEERTSFQLLTYVRLENAIVRALEADSYNSSCKDAMDRGGVISALRFYLALVENGLEEDPQALKVFRTILHAPALLIKEQAVISGRHKRLLHVLGILKDTETKKRIRARTHGHTVSVDHCAGQSILPLFGRTNDPLEHLQSMDLDLASKIPAKKISEYRKWVIKSGGYLSKNGLLDKNKMEKQLKKDIPRAFIAFTEEGSPKAVSSNKKRVMYKYKTLIAQLKNFVPNCDDARAQEIMHYLTQTTQGDLADIPSERYMFMDAKGFPSVTVRQDADLTKTEGGFKFIKTRENKVFLEVAQYFKVTSFVNNSDGQDYACIKGGLLIDLESDHATVRFTKRNTNGMAG